MLMRLVINHVGLCSSLLSSLTHSSCVRSFTCDTFLEDIIEKFNLGKLQGSIGEFGNIDS